MKRAALVLGLVCFLTLPLVAQDLPEGQDLYNGLHRKGSQLISLSVGAGVPLFILPVDPLATEARPLQTGGAFTLGYHYFLADRISLGGSLTGAFNTTVGGRSLFMAPIAANFRYWFGRESLEFNLGADAGLAIMRLSGNGVISPFLKAGGGAFVQITEVWGLGGQAFWWLIPEIHTGASADLTRYGNFLELSLGAVYHF